MRERFDELRRMGIRTVMITGDNPLTAKAIADEAGVDDFLAEATPEDKMALIKREQEGGKLVAMTGDGTNDAPALAQADVGVAMNTGTSAAKEAGNMVDLDSDPTKLIEIVEIGKQLLITRGALTTFSIANDVAKYFAIIPAMFVGVFPGLHRLNVMAPAQPEVGDPVRDHLQRARHHRADPAGAARRARTRRARPRQMLRRNLAIYGLGGLIVPFLGIKLIDLRRPVHPRNPVDRMNTDLRATLRQYAAALRALLVLTVVLGVLYPLVVTGVGQVVVPRQANGSLVQLGGQGRRLQPARPELQPTPRGTRCRQYFQPRPSAAATATTRRRPAPPTSARTTPTWSRPSADRRAAVAAFDGVAPASVPADALTASGSGLDPDISPAYAVRAGRPGRAGAPPRRVATVHALVAAHVQGRTLGFLGEPTGRTSSS